MPRGGSRFEVDRGGIRDFLRSPGVQGVCVRVAQDEATAMAARTAVDTGETRDSTHVEPAMFDDRAGAWIVQAGAAVQTHWGNERTVADHHGLPGGGDR